uniref:Uncharacterized protein n=1 Tax=Anguilla anguilla TaxID=7936 RepID=A0A0E9Y1Z6_ANGAN
MNLNLNITL